MKKGQRIGRVCPVVRQQCRLNHGCALFDVAVTDQRTLDDKARAWHCPKRGAYVFPDELKNKRFDPGEHDVVARYNAMLRHIRRTQTLRRKRDQRALPFEDEILTDVRT